MRVWLKIKSAALRQDLSERKMRDLLKEGLRHSRLPSGTILIKDEWLDEYFGSYEVKENQIDNIVDEVMEGLS